MRERYFSKITDWGACKPADPLPLVIEDNPPKNLLPQDCEDDREEEEEEDVEDNEERRARDSPPHTPPLAAAVVPVVPLLWGGTENSETAAAARCFPSAAVAGPRKAEMAPTDAIFLRLSTDSSVTHESTTRRFSGTMQRTSGFTKAVAVSEELRTRH